MTMMVDVRGYWNRQIDISQTEMQRQADGQANGVMMMSNECAVAIATQWQSPGTIGNVLARFASTHAAPVSDLCHDIDATLHDLEMSYPSRYLEEYESYTRQLKALKAWARWFVSGE